MRAGDDPHYDLLEQLINRLGGPIVHDAEAEAITAKFHNSLGLMTAAEATGVLAGVEHPALTISWYLHRMIELCGATELLAADPYLTIHVRVEPEHIIWAHGKGVDYLATDERETVIRAFRQVMAFWEEYWPLAFSRLNYPLYARAA